MAKKNDTTSKKHIIWAFVSAFLFLYLATIIIYLGANFLRVYLDQTIYESAYTKLVFATTLEGVPVQTLQNFVSSISAGGVIYGVMYLMILQIYFFTGWILAKTAKTIPWALSGMPLLVVGLFALIPKVSGSYFFLGYPLYLFFFDESFKYIIVAVAIIFSFLGGYFQRHLSLTWRK